LLGLYAQRRYGVGQEIYVNMLTANAYANSDDFLQYEGKPPRRQVDGELYGTAPWYRLYEASDGWVFFAAPTRGEWEAFCAEAAPHLSDQSADDEAAMTAAIADIFAQAPAAEWETRLTAVGVGCVQADAGSVGDFLSKDAHVLANGFSPIANHRRLGNVRRWGPLTKMAGGRDDYGPGVLAGQETNEILAEVGRSDEEIARLRSEGVVWSEPVELE
jgi:crotonobetainyl-CoA:carnitine CoA-transferase CaiB-like acyl-CoA transferase